MSNQSAHYHVVWLQVQKDMQSDKTYCTKKVQLIVQGTAPSKMNKSAKIEAKV